MTLEEAIKHCKEVAELNRNQWKNCPAEKDTREHLTCEQCAEEHEQLAEWLEELVELRKTPRPKGKWKAIAPREFLDVRMKCSVCSQIETPFARWQFCPNCGADMRGEEK